MSKEQYDAWKVDPPCNHGDLDHCHKCPYYDECWEGQYEEEED